MLGSWILLIGIVSTAGSFLYGLWRTERNASYDDRYAVFGTQVGLALLVIHAVFFFKWSELPLW